MNSRPWELSSARRNTMPLLRSLFLWMPISMQENTRLYLPSKEELRRKLVEWTVEQEEMA